jgi:hypothetical protein
MWVAIDDPRADDVGASFMLGDERFGPHVVGEAVIFRHRHVVCPCLSNPFGSQRPHVALQADVDDADIVEIVLNGPRNGDAPRVRCQDQQLDPVGYGLTPQVLDCSLDDVISRHGDEYDA